jgi:prophage maintenance system killer protein
MSAALRHPTVEAVIAIHAQILTAHGGATGIRSRDEITTALRNLLR